MFGVKSKATGSTAWFFVAPNGGRSRLRVHAVLYTSKAAAETAATELGKLNPTYAFKAVTLGKEKK